jgi:hypothetical protein
MSDELMAAQTGGRRTYLSKNSFSPFHISFGRWWFSKNCGGGKMKLPYDVTSNSQLYRLMRLGIRFVRIVECLVFLKLWKLDRDSIGGGFF